MVFLLLRTSAPLHVGLQELVTPHLQPQMLLFFKCLVLNRGGNAVLRGNSVPCSSAGAGASSLLQLFVCHGALRAARASWMHPEILMRLLAGLGCAWGAQSCSLPWQGFTATILGCFWVQSRAWNEVQEEAVEDFGSSHNQRINSRDPVDPACPPWLLFLCPAGDALGDTERSPALLQPS